MPLVVIGKGRVEYQRPNKQELPQIGSLVCMNEIVQSQHRRAQIAQLSISMSFIQEAYLHKESQHGLRVQ
jgi:hypothetical protein